MRICIHALTAIMSLLSLFIHGISAETIKDKNRDDKGYIQGSGNPLVTSLNNSQICQENFKF